jgi:hypothetical protein
MNIILLLLLFNDYYTIIIINTAGVIGGKQSISGGDPDNPLEAFYDIHVRKGE